MRLCSIFKPRGKNAGQAFVAISFRPAGGDSRLYLPQGSYDWKTFDYSCEVPPGATKATVSMGLESKTDALWINDLSVVLSAKKRTSLAAHWIPRPHDRIFPQAGPPADTLLALNISGLDTDTVMFVTTMQGLINRKQPRIYVFENPAPFWADWLVKKKYVSTIKELPNVQALLDAFRSEIHGVIVYDPNLPASRHAAVMLGAIQGYRLPVALRRKASAWPSSPI